MRTKHKPFRLYLSDEQGAFNKYEPQKVTIKNGLLVVGKRIGIKLSEIASCELKKVHRSRREYIEIIFCCAHLNQGQLTPLLLVNPHFLSGISKNRVMPNFVALIQSQIRDNNVEQLIINAQTALENEEIPEGLIEMSYTINVSVAIMYYRRTWYSFDSPRKALIKSYMLILLGSIINIFGILVFFVPIDNWNMAKNIEQITGSKTQRYVTFFVSLAIPIVLWLTILSITIF